MFFVQVATQGNSVNIVTSHNYSGNVQDCNMIESRGDIPEVRCCLLTATILSNITQAMACRVNFLVAYLL